MIDVVNGRDSYYLCKRYKVSGVDNCGFKPNEVDNCEFIIDNFVTIDKTKFDLIYSRFTFL